MIKLETHCHTPGASPCADCDFDLAVKKYAAAGYGGVILTSHFCSIASTSIGVVLVVVVVFNFGFIRYFF